MNLALPGEVVRILIMERRMKRLPSSESSVRMSTLAASGNSNAREE